MQITFKTITVIVFVFSFLRSMKRGYTANNLMMNKDKDKLAGQSLRNSLAGQSSFVFSDNISLTEEQHNIDNQLQLLPINVEISSDAISNEKLNRLCNTNGSLFFSDFDQEQEEFSSFLSRIDRKDFKYVLHDSINIYPFYVKEPSFIASDSANNQIYIIKQYKRDSFVDFEKEIAMLKALNEGIFQDNYRVVSYIGCLYDKGYLYILTEPNKVYQTLSEPLVQQEVMNLDGERKKLFLLSLAKMVKTVHDKGIIHNNLTPDNILVNVTNMEMRLIDFKLAKYYQTSSTYSMTDYCPYLNFLDISVKENLVKNEMTNLVQLFMFIEPSIFATQFDNLNKKYYFNSITQLQHGYYKSLYNLSKQHYTTSLKRIIRKNCNTKVLDNERRKKLTQDNLIPKGKAVYKVFCNPYYNLLIQTLSDKQSSGISDINTFISALEQVENTNFNFRKPVKQPDGSTSWVDANFVDIRNNLENYTNKQIQYFENRNLKKVILNKRDDLLFII